MNRRRNAHVSLNLPFTPGNNRRRESDFSLFKTPAKRARLEHDDDITFSAPINDDGNEALEAFLGNVWHVHRVTQLVDFKYHHKSLKRYSRILSQQLVSDSVDHQYKVMFSMMSAVARNDKDDPAVNIQIADIRTGTPRIVYEGILASSRTSDVASAERITHLPVLLARGSEPIRQSVHRILSSMFACTVHKTEFCPEDMLWLVASWSGFVTEKKNMNWVDFTFETPKGLIGIKWGLNAVKELWKCIKQSDEPSVNEKEVRVFHSALYAHVQRCVGIALARTLMTAFKTPNVELYSSGEIRIKDVDFIPRILSSLTNICEFRLRAIFPETE